MRLNFPCGGFAQRLYKPFRTQTSHLEGYGSLGSTKIVKFGTFWGKNSKIWDFLGGENSKILQKQAKK